MNSISVIGRITNDIELKKVGETEFVAFQIAVRRNFKNAAGEYDSDFLPCIVSGKPAETFAKFLKKGNLIGIRGSLRSQTKEKDGQKVTFYSISIDDFDFLEKKPDPKAEKASAEAEVPFESS